MINITEQVVKPEENVKHLLELIEELVLDSTKIPILNKLIIDEEKLFALLDGLSKNLPAEMDESKEIVKNKNRILQETQVRATEMLQGAEAKAREMLEISQSKAREMLEASQAKAREMLEGAQTKAKELVESAELKSKETIENAESQAKELLANAEIRSQILMNENEILKRVQVESDSLRMEARANFEKSKDDSDSYADSVLGHLEDKLSKTLVVIRNGREKISQI